MAVPTLKTTDLKDSYFLKPQNVFAETCGSEAVTEHFTNQFSSVDTH